MEQEIIQAWDNGKDSMPERFAKLLAENDYPEYLDVVRVAVEMLRDNWPRYKSDAPSPEHITEVEGGPYQGTNGYMIKADSDKYYAVAVSYGSCSVCDTLQSICADTEPEQQPAELTTMALHIVQAMRIVNSV